MHYRKNVTFANSDFADMS